MNNFLEINIDNFKHNIKEIKKIIGDDIDIMPIIKANGYGTHLNTRIDLLSDFKIVGVANVFEGVNLRNLGFQKEIFILNEPSITDIDNIIKYDLTVGVSDLNFINEVSKRENNIKIHIEIDTGMGRTGIKVNEVPSFIESVLNKKNITLEGIYTHLSSADNDDAYTKKQLDNFDKVVSEIKKYIPNIKYIHSLASNGIINYHDYKKNYNLVRPGIILYGYKSYKDANINLKPVCTLKSKVTFIKKVPKGTSISYGRTFITEKEAIIATVPIGYADGIKRSLSNIGKVVINNHIFPIVGTICMDNLMVDISCYPNVSLNDEVYIWDNDKITVEDIASICNTINYEILTSISDRVIRIFK